MKHGWHIILAVVSLCLPARAFSSQSAGFSPPASDTSVIFLGNIFGLVDGVLHGSGSQILGAIFSVFNTAVLALTGIVMTYIIIVSTMNTAHEGQMLGQKWSSIWVPVRATSGLALLVPKASGYCLMQVFVMWVVVQGVGVADKVWETALDYLNHGGVIIQSQMDPIVSKIADNNSIIKGAATILYGQVCMTAIQKELEKQRNVYLERQENGSGPCDLATKDSFMAELCERSVPNFLSTVDPVTVYDTSSPNATAYRVPMPHFDSSPYDALNGICGEIQWNAMNLEGLTSDANEEEEAEEREDDDIDDLASHIEREITRQATSASEGSLIAHEVTPDSPAYKVYAKFSFTKAVSSAGSTVGGALGGSEGAAIGGGVGGAIGGRLDDAASKDYTDPETYNPANEKNWTGGWKEGWEEGSEEGSGGGSGIPGIPGAGLGFSLNELVDALKGSGTGPDQAGEMGPDDFGGATMQATPPPFPDIEVGVGTVWQLTDADIDTIKKSRAAAIEQMYVGLASTARAIVDNDPEIIINHNDPADYTSRIADYQYGIPLNKTRTACAHSTDDCPYWGGLLGTSSSVLLSGTELQDAVTDYNAIMQPALKLISEAKNAGNEANERQFIERAKRSGWILAGSYFFDLVRLNGNAVTPGPTDVGSGLGNSIFSLDALDNMFDGGAACSIDHSFAQLCYLFDEEGEPGNHVINLFRGVTPTNVTQSTLSSSVYSLIDDDGASTVYGYVNNAMLIDLPGQSGLTLSGLGSSLADIKLNARPWTPKRPSMACGGVPFIGCIGKVIQSTIWEISVGLLKQFANFCLMVIQLIWNDVVVRFIDAFGGVFDRGIRTISSPGGNPIVQLAIMGVDYINIAMSLWVAMLVIAVGFSWAPPLYAMMMIILPVFFAWVSVMLGIAFTTAYYIPFLPYMIFTFGTIAWLISVVEAMVAAPLVALGIAHPKGHQALGKSEQGLMILLNVFLRPAMMVIGFIAAIALCYVGVWILNSGFVNALTQLRSKGIWDDRSALIPWGSIFGYFFSIIIYTMTYLTIVEKAFSLIVVLPDKVLRWIGGHDEKVGQEAAQWTGDVKKKMGEAGEAMEGQVSNIQKQVAGGVGDAGMAAKEAVTGGAAKGSMGAEGGGES